MYVQTIEHFSQPIATPPATLQALRDIKSQREHSVDPNQRYVLGEAQSRLEDETKCLWYEFTPFEVGCDEIGGTSRPRHMFYIPLISI